jgi:hypothetical protein
VLPKVRHRHRVPVPRAHAHEEAHSAAVIEHTLIAVDDAGGLVHELPLHVEIDELVLNHVDDLTPTFVSWSSV